MDEIVFLVDRLLFQIKTKGTIFVVFCLLGFPCQVSCSTGNYDDDLKDGCTINMIIGL